jgi:hypothetical protein
MTKKLLAIVTTTVVIVSLVVYVLAQPPAATNNTGFLGTNTPTPKPSQIPTTSATPSATPGSTATAGPTQAPTNNPMPTQNPTQSSPSPTAAPTATTAPTPTPTLAPTPTPTPTIAPGTVATFNFDNDPANLYLRQPTPVTQTNSGITAQFTSATIPASAFSIQTQSTTQFVLSKTSGNYLEHNYAGRNALDITFNQPIKSITLTFATIDYHDPAAGNPTPMQLTAYSNAAKTTAVGSPVTVSGSFITGDSYPQGTITFSSATPFSTVEIQTVYLTQGAVDYIIDNVVVTAA